jgi:hypothetical protein
MEYEKGMQFQCLCKCEIYTIAEKQGQNWHLTTASGKNERYLTAEELDSLQAIGMLTMLETPLDTLAKICDDFGQALGNFIGTMDEIVEEFEPILKRLNDLRDKTGGVK